MLFNPVGFAIGLAIAQRNNLSQSAAVPVALITGAAGSTPMGMVLALALAQRSAPVAATATGAPAGTLQLLPPAISIASPSNVRAKAKTLGEQIAITVHWDHVPNATKYMINTFVKESGSGTWEDSETIVVGKKHDEFELFAPRGVSLKSVQNQLEYSVAAFGLGQCSAPSDRVSPTLG